MKNKNISLSMTEKVYDMLELVGKQGDEHPSNTIDNFQIILKNNIFASSLQILIR